MIVTTNELYKHAYGKYLVGAYTVNNLEQIVGLFRGSLGKTASNDKSSDKTKSAPFIVQISRGCLYYSDMRFLKNLVRAAEDVFPDAIFAVHLDHGNEKYCYDCINSGFVTSVSIDASFEEFEDNIEITRRVVERAHDKGIVVEAELRHNIKYVDDIEFAEDELTNPYEAAEFIDRTGCDSLAVTISAIHGPFKFLQGNDIYFDILARIQKTIPANFPLVMHGYSSIPNELIRRINIAGGKVSNIDSGINEAYYSRLSKNGICKVGFDIDVRLVWCVVHREEFILQPENIDLRQPGEIFMASYADYIIHKNAALGSAGQLESLRDYLRKQLRKQRYVI